jgi:dTDP-4-dehydro-6-deoxy-alpha-D-glucopyranose 2,3-dehydratase
MVHKESAEVRVQVAANGLPNWSVEEDFLRNSQTDYFKIGVFRDTEHKLKLFLQQEEEALIGLLITRTNQGVYFLVSLRSEPGLMHKTCISTTIQSTYSNYSQKHGGKETPYLKYVQGNSGEKLLLDSTEFDWCDIYDGKTKRFRVVEVDTSTPVRPGFAWVSFQTISRILKTDNLISTDLRACLALSWEILLSNDPEIEQGLAKPLRRLAQWQQEHHSKIILEDFRSAQLQEAQHETYLDDYGNKVQYFQTEANSREVSSWVQPLLIRKRPGQISLYELCKREKRYAIVRSTQMGTDGKAIWFPAEPLRPLGTRVSSCEMSGEGGRFYKYQLLLEIRSLASEFDKTSALWPAGTVWVNHGEMSEILKTPLSTSLELRSAWSLVLAAGN